MSALLLSVVAPIGAAAAGPQLGLQMTPAPLYAAESRTLVMTSRADVPMRVSLAVDGLGWAVEPAFLTIAPGERRAVAVTNVGLKPATITARAEPIGVTGDLVGTVTVTTKMYDARPADEWPLVPLVALAGVLGLLIASWRVLTWRYHRR